MKKITCLLFIGIITFICVGCSQNENNVKQEVKNIEQTKTYDTVHIASNLAHENIKELLNSNYKLKGNVYYTKSKSFNNAYFIGAIADKNGEFFNCIWFANTPDMSGDTNSANDYAVEVSGMPDARKFSTPISIYDDGYSRILDKLVSDMNTYNKQK